MNLQPTKNLLVIALIAMTVAAQAKDIKVFVDGSSIDFANQGPRMSGERVVVPLRGVFERLGVSVDWNESDQSITCMKDSRKIWLRIGDQDARVDDKDVHLDQAAMVYRGTTMVPLRFVSESLGATVHWDDAMQEVHITTATNYDQSSNNDYQGNNNGGRDNNGQNNNGNLRNVTFDAGTVVPVTLNNDLSSDKSRVGDKFTATIGTDNNMSYGGLPKGSKISGHVTTVRAKTDKEPGALAVSFDSIVSPRGMKTPINGSLIGLDDKSVENKGDLIVARDKNSAKSGQNIWIGAGAGAVIALLTKGNLLTDTVIGGALGYLYDQLHLGGSKSNDVRLNKGSTFGVRLDSDLIARIGR